MSVRTITVKGDPVRSEALASGAIKPGHLVKLASTATDTVAVHNSAGQNCEKLFAIENDMKGDGVTVEYADGELVQLGLFRPGDVVQARIADGQNIAKGDYLESAGAGELQKHTPDVTSTTPANIYTNQIVGCAQEACDMSGSSGEDPDGLCKIRIM